jgi:hypothetical protein
LSGLRERAIDRIECVTYCPRVIDECGVHFF